MLENRIRDLEGRLQGPNEPHLEPTRQGSHHHHHHHHQPRFRSSDGSGGGEAAKSSLEGHRSEEHDRDYRRQLSHRQGDSPEQEVGHFGTGARKGRGTSSNFVHEPWLYGEARIENTVGGADSSSSTFSGGGSPIVIEKGAQPIPFQNGEICGGKAQAAGRGVGTGKRGARLRGGRRRESGNPPGIVLI